MSDLFEFPLPATGPVKLNRDKLAEHGFAGSKIVQSGGSFRMHTDEIAVTLDPLDALWVIDSMPLVAERSPIMRRVCVWTKAD
jgi:hypothetical protein